MTGGDRLTGEPAPAVRQSRRRRRLTVNGVAVAVIVIATVASVVVQSRAVDAYPPFYDGPYATVTLHADSTVTMARPGITAPVVNVYEDYQCPICDEFERANGGVLQQLAYQGKAVVVYHLFTIFLGTQPRQANSTRAWAAARCVPGISWPRYHNLLYASQPAETTAGGFPVSQLLALGRRIGLAGPAFTRCVSSQQFAPDIVGVSERVQRAGVNATPTVTLDGHAVSTDVLVTPGITLRQMILAAH
jgi:protein-disulfide isomerase